MPDGPGLGLELDRSELERLGKLTKRVIPDFIVRSRFKNGATMLTATKEGARGGCPPHPSCRRLRQQQPCAFTPTVVRCPCSGWMTRPQSSFKTPPQAYDQVRPAPLPPGVFHERHERGLRSAAGAGNGLLGRRRDGGVADGVGADAGGGRLPAHGARAALSASVPAALVSCEFHMAICSILHA